MTQEQRTYVGKFASEADEFAYQVTLDGCDDECGTVEFGGTWHGSVWFSPTDAAELETLGVVAGYAIVHEGSQGFVSVDYFASHTDWHGAWSEIVAAETDGEDL